MFTSQRDSNPFNPIIAGLSETSIRPLVELLIHTINQVDLDASDAVARFPSWYAMPSTATAAKDGGLIL
ncbi:MAG: hypothetical protein ABSB39_05695 [Candidatus Sulfotelmatobacter sp.]